MPLSLSARLGRRPAPRRALADSAPRIRLVGIDPEKVGALIGPGGRVIRGIEADSGADQVSVSLPPPRVRHSPGASLCVCTRHAEELVPCLRWSLTLTRSPPRPKSSPSLQCGTPEFTMRKDRDKVA